MRHNRQLLPFRSSIYVRTKRRPRVLQILDRENARRFFPTLRRSNAYSATELLPGACRVSQRRESWFERRDRGRCRRSAADRSDSCSAASASTGVKSLDQLNNMIVPEPQWSVVTGVLSAQ